MKRFNAAFSICILLNINVDTVAAVPAAMTDNSLSFSETEGIGLLKRNDVLLQIRKAGPACEDRCKKPCKNKGMVRIPGTCRCDCPPGTKLENKLCIPENGKDCPQGSVKLADGQCVKSGDDDKNKPNSNKPSPDDKEKSFQERKTREKTSYDDRKKKAGDDQKASDDDEKKKKKINRVGRCVQLVSVTIGIDTAEDFADEFYSEDLLAGDEMLEFWDDDAEKDAPLDDEAVEKYLNDPASIEEWFDESDLSSFAGPGKKQKRIAATTEGQTGAAENSLDERSPPSLADPDKEKRALATTTQDGTTSSLQQSHHNVKRFWAVLIEGLVAFGAMIGRAAGSIARAGRGAGAAIGNISKLGFRLAKQGAKLRVPKEEQLKSIRNPLKMDRNWGNCLRGKKYQV